MTVLKLASPLFFAVLFAFGQVSDVVQQVAPDTTSTVLNTVLAVVGALGLVPLAKKLIDRRLDKADKAEARLVSERAELERRLAIYAGYSQAIERWTGGATAMLTDDQIARIGPPPPPPLFYSPPPK